MADAKGGLSLFDMSSSSVFLSLSSCFWITRCRLSPLERLGSIWPAMEKQTGMPNAAFKGRTDTALNSKGRQQAAKLAERLKGIHLDAVYSSTLSRSRETAAIARGGAPLKSLAGLNERNHGKFEGKKVDGSDPVTEQECRRRRCDPEDELDGGESLNQFYERVRTTFGAIRGQHSSGAILIVGHALTNQMILRALFWPNSPASHLDPAGQ